MDAHKNFALATVAVAPTPSASGTSLELSSGQAALFPAVPFNAVVYPSGANPLSTNAEIVRVTNVSGDTFTITRQQEGTSARSITVGDQICAGVMVKSLTDIEDAVSVVSQALSVETAARVAADDSLSNSVSVVSHGLSVETAARVAKDDLLSTAISVVSQGLSVVSNAASHALSVAVAASLLASVADAHASTASLAATSVNNRVNSVNSFISGISARSAGNVSTHGFQSVIDALSNRISGVTGGSGSVTSNEASAISAQAASAISVVSDAVTSVNARVNSVNTFISGISARSAGASTHGFQSVVNALSHNISVVSQAASAAEAHASTASAAATSADGHANTASAAATSVNARVNSVNTFLSGISARSVGDVSTHGVQSVINALSGRISHEHSVFSQAISVVSQAASAAEAHASAASAAATSVNNRVNTLSAIVSEVVSAVSNVSATSSGGGSATGLQAVVDALSNKISATGAGAGSVTSNELSHEASVRSAADAGLSVRIDTQSQSISVISQQVSVLSQRVSVLSSLVSTVSQAVTSVDTRVNTVSNIVSGVVSGASVRSVGDVSTHGHQSILNALSGRISHEHSVFSQAVSVVSQAASVADAHASVASLAATSADGHANTASAAATSVNARVNSVNTFISGISSRSVGDVSTHGLQSVIDALSNRISAGGGAGSVTSNEVSMAANTASLAATSVDARVNALSQLHSVLSQDHSVLSQRVSVLSGVVSAVSLAVTSVDARVNTVSNIVSTVVSGASVRSVGDVSTHGHQSILNALSGRISHEHSVFSQAVSVVSQAASAAEAHASTASAAATSVNSRVNSVNTFISGISSRSVGNVSTHGFQSVIDALSNRISAGGGTASVTSAEVHTVSVKSVGGTSVQGLQSVVNALSSRISAVIAGTASATSQELSVTANAVVSALNGTLSTLPAGTPVYFQGGGGVLAFGRAAVSFGGQRAWLAGILLSDTTSTGAGGIGKIQTQGIVSLTSDQWGAVLSTGGTAGLIPGTPYVVASTAGLIETQSAMSAFQSLPVPAIGVAMDANRMLLLPWYAGDDIHRLQSVLFNEISARAVSTNALSVAISALQSELRSAVSVVSHAVSVVSAQDASATSHLLSLISALSQTTSVQHAALSVRINSVAGGASVAPTGRVTNTNTAICAAALTDISGLCVSVSVGGVYKLDGMVMYSVSAATGNAFGLVFPAMTKAGGKLLGNKSVNPSGTSTFSLYEVGGFDEGDSGSAVWSAAAVGPAGTFLLEITGLLVPSATGVVKVQARASVATNSIVVQAGSFLKVFRMN